MAIAGRVAIVPKDDYDASLIYKRLDAVMHNNTLYIAKKDVPAGKVPGADTKDYWMSGPSAGTSKPATTTSNGLMSATDKKAIEVLKKPLATCATGRATAAKVATLANFVLQVGTSIAVKFTDTVGTANPTTGNLTLNVNGTGAKTIGYVRNGNKVAISYVSGNFFYNNATHIFTYDGTFWLCMDWNADNNTTYSNFVKSGAGAKAGLVPAPSTTAGTSKYLREDGTWQTPPDTKTSVVNNQTTTVAGYALDARQANPNIDGTLAKQVADLNGSLNHSDNFKFRKIINNWSSASQVSGGCGIYHVNTIEDNFYNSISKHVTAFRNVGDYSLIIFSWNGLETLNYGIGLLASPRSTTLCFVQVWEGNFILYDI